MRPYGSKRSFDTEPRIKSARALVKRETEALIKEQAPEPLEEKDRCICGAIAAWSYDPSPLFRCDACVPRGCSCQDDPSEPCIEWSGV